MKFYEHSRLIGAILMLVSLVIADLFGNGTSAFVPIALWSFIADSFIFSLAVNKMYGHPTNSVFSDSCVGGLLAIAVITTLGLL